MGSPVATLTQLVGAAWLCPFSLLAKTGIASGPLGGGQPNALTHSWQITLRTSVPVRLARTGACHERSFVVPSRDVMSLRITG